MHIYFRSMFVGLGSLSLVVFAGCASDKHAGKPAVQMDPSEHGFVAGTGVESQDLVQVSDKMARSIIATPQIANAKNPPTIGLLPVENNTRFPIQKDIFNKRIKALLNSKCAGKVTFVARDRIDALKKEKSMKAAGEVTNTGEKPLLGVDFFLTGELTGLSSASSAGRSDYVLYTFRLIDAENSAEVWEDMDEIKKQGLEDAAYR
ncbi:MAG: penicillin-binding protein activator LpoB [Verrucomicrobiae bacterium]|nr:penicillin-binding protein activator LpoB [Verrucomicrobiae bacterium]